MNGPPDQQLLRDYSEHRSEPAFAELVRRHVDLVHSAAMRMVCDAHLAKDVTQGVFIALAKNAPGLAECPVLSGWLHHTARNLAANVVRSEVRRRTREQESVAMNELFSAESETSWQAIAPYLDAALGELSEADRDALLLRYFEKKSASEMAGILGVSDEAAQKRVTRAVERLREFFSKRNVTIGAGGLVVLISAHAVQSAPVGLAATISAIAFAGTAAVTASAFITATKTIAMTTLQKALVTVTVAALAGAGIYEARQAAQLRAQLQALQQQQMPLAGQVKQMQNDRDDVMNQLAALKKSQFQPSSNQMELLKLRGEIAQLKGEENDPVQKSLKEAARKVGILKRRLEQTPHWKIPEFQFLTDKDWATAAWDADVDTDDGIRVALSKLRETAVNTFLNEMMKAAFKKYLAANNNILPGALTQLEPYFDAPVTDDMLQRYQLMQSGTPDNSAELVKLIAYADDDYDSTHGMSINGAWGGGF
ncbi:MAG TPA: sigma-70 family RNA polymerase sigma factor, partial [Verrucomicrobiae bacterium]|nr:sigma-70 family RNA polymerase sigma factor [Verrucomicrobiae bacterium]